MMKHLIVLVGPQGSGKTTYAHTHFYDYTRISQDEMGKDGHMKEFLSAIESGKDIVVDRINHTREQRARYITVAKAAGYLTQIVEFFEPYKTCYERMMFRTGHPTIKAFDSVTVRNALDTYFNQYEYIRDNEADVIARSKRNPMVWDLTDEAKKAHIIGDIHGCFTEMVQCLRHAGLSEKDIVIAVGDLVDRGPHIMEVVKTFVMNPNYYSVRGNHDNKFIRWLRGNKVQTDSLKETITQFELDGSFSKDELYMELMSLPYIIKFGNSFITHAGFYPDSRPEYTSSEFCMYARKYDPTLRTFTNDNTKPYWYTFLKDQDHNLFFGHEIHEDCIPQAKVYALDGGCYLGNEIRVATVNHEGEVAVTAFESLQPKQEKEMEWDHMNKFEPYDKLVDQGYLNKQESGDLCLFNYTDKAQYDKIWNKYTIESRGIIFNKNTGDTVARPFPKFWNMSELISENEIENED